MSEWKVAGRIPSIIYYYFNFFLAYPEVYAKLMCIMCSFKIFEWHCSLGFASYCLQPPPPSIPNPLFLDKGLVQDALHTFANGLLLCSPFVRYV